MMPVAPIQMFKDVKMEYLFNQEPNFRNSAFRNEAKRNFIFWQHGCLGARRRLVVPACVGKTVREMNSKDDTTLQVFILNKNFFFLLQMHVSFYFS